MTKVTKTQKTPTKQGDYEVGNKKPPKNRRFGEKEGNPRHNGAWKKEDTLRFKLQQVSKMTTAELENLLRDPQAGEFEKNAARTIIEMSSLDPEKRWRILEGLTNQDGGYPKQQVDQTNYEVPIPLSPRQIITEPQPKPIKSKKKPTRKKTKKK